MIHIDFAAVEAVTLRLPPMGLFKLRVILIISFAPPQTSSTNFRHLSDGTSPTSQLAPSDQQEIRPERALRDRSEVHTLSWSAKSKHTRTSRRSVAHTSQIGIHISHGSCQHALQTVESSLRPCFSLTKDGIATLHGARTMCL